MTLLEYVKKIPGHKNSKGESAPWTIVSHKTGKVISSHKTKEEAEKHLQRMHYFKEGLEMRNFEKYVEYVEKNTGLDFSGDLGQDDTISDYKEETGRDLDYLVALTDDNSGVTIGYSVGEKGDETFNYVVSPTNGETVYEDDIVDWEEAAKKVVKLVKDLASNVSESKMNITEAKDWIEEGYVYEIDSAKDSDNNEIYKSTYGKKFYDLEELVEEFEKITKTERETWVVDIYNGFISITVNLAAKTINLQKYEDSDKFKRVIYVRCLMISPMDTFILKEQSERIEFGEINEEE